MLAPRPALFSERSLPKPMSRKYIYTFAALVAVAAVVLGYQKSAPRSQKEDREAAAVRAVLEAQAAAWNRGDVEGDMEGYAKEGKTTFVSGDTITRGWRTVLERYKAH